VNRGAVEDGWSGRSSHDWWRELAGRGRSGAAIFGGADGIGQSSRRYPNRMFVGYAASLPVELLRMILGNIFKLCVGFQERIELCRGLDQWRNGSIYDSCAPAFLNKQLAIVD
jgi:hypothetical protein